VTYFVVWYDAKKLEREIP